MKDSAWGYSENKTLKGLGFFFNGELLFTWHMKAPIISLATNQIISQRAHDIFSQCRC
jgi:hypothetical protein